MNSEEADEAQVLAALNEIREQIDQCSDAIDRLLLRQDMINLAQRHGISI